ncbi:MAG: hypothetical protein ACQERH_09180, partial [Acidobacteriota bacterium]
MSRKNKEKFIIFLLKFIYVLILLKIFERKGKGFITRSIPQRGISLPVRASLSSKEEPCPL